MISAKARKKISTFSFFEGVELDDNELVYKKLKKNRIANENFSGKENIGVILNGTIDVYSVSIDGAEIKLTSLSEGDVYGICNLYYEFDRMTVLKCRNDCEMIFIRKSYFRELLETDIDFMRRYLSLLNKKINFLLNRTEMLTMQSGRAKVINYLISNECDGNIELGESKESWAKSLGISRAALFRELSNLKKDNLISVKNNLIHIDDINLLERKLYDGQ